MNAHVRDQSGPWKSLNRKQNEKVVSSARRDVLSHQGARDTLSHSKPNFDLFRLRPHVSVPPCGRAHLHAHALRNPATMATRLLDAHELSCDELIKAELIHSEL
jgi:hypothetical protein